MNEIGGDSVIFQFMSTNEDNCRRNGIILEPPKNNFHSQLSSFRKLFCVISLFISVFILGNMRKKKSNFIHFKRKRWSQGMETRHLLTYVLYFLHCCSHVSHGNLVNDLFQSHVTVPSISE